MEPQKDPQKVKAAKARKAALSPERRAEIAKKAAESRWAGDLPVAEHEGTLTLGGKEISCAVLQNGARIITQAAFMQALGRAGRPKGGTGVLSTIDELPFFLQAEVLKPFITSDLMQSTTPLFYRTISGSKAVGYDARLLPLVAEVYLKFRDAAVAENGEVPARYERMISAADVLIRALANVGIIALVDEATGFQRFRTDDALNRILEQFIAKELQPYVPTFQSEFYRQIYRLRGLEYPTDSVKRPQYFGSITNDIVYKRLAPGVLEELKRVTPRLLSGRHKDKLFQRLTSNRGYPKLREHLGAVETMMQLSTNWHDFMEKLDRLRPRLDIKSLNDSRQLSFDYDSKADTGKGL